MSGTNRGFVIANDFDRKGRYRGVAKRQWEAERRKALGPNQEPGLTGAALETAVMAIAAADSSLVKIEQRGA